MAERQRTAVRVLSVLFTRAATCFSPPRDMPAKRPPPVVRAYSTRPRPAAMSQEKTPWRDARYNHAPPETKIKHSPSYGEHGINITTQRERPRTNLLQTIYGLADTNVSNRQTNDPRAAWFRCLLA